MINESHTVQGRGVVVSTGTFQWQQLQICSWLYLPVSYSRLASCKQNIIKPALCITLTQQKKKMADLHTANYFLLFFVFFMLSFFVIHSCTDSCLVQRVRYTRPSLFIRLWIIHNVNTRSFWTGYAVWRHSKIIQKSSSGLLAFLILDDAATSDTRLCLILISLRF